MSHLGTRQRIDYRLRLGIRDGWQCWICGIPILIDNSTIDHIIPMSEGKGKHGIHNMKLACYPCNQIRSGARLKKSVVEDHKLNDILLWAYISNDPIPYHQATSHLRKVK